MWGKALGSLLPPLTPAVTPGRNLTLDNKRSPWSLVPMSSMWALITKEGLRNVLLKNVRTQEPNPRILRKLVVRASLEDFDMCHTTKACLMIRDECLFKNLPVEYCWEEIKGSDSSNVSDDISNPARSQLSSEQGDPRPAQTSVLHGIKQSSNKLVRHALAHSLGRWLLYPGSVCLFNKVPLSLLVKGRARLMEDFHGKRAKLVARDGNKIDTMFVDRRNRKDPRQKGMRLVICCEGNGSFYEIGCLATPLKAGYSVLGWNHPGFARSTGKPYPKNDINAMEVVLQYAIHRLNFSLPDIVIYGYSLGSYTATWAAMTYPNLGGLILDASFDGLIPLAVNMIDKRWKKLVVKIVMEHFDLNVVHQLCKYPGAVLLIRRTLDEITSTEFSKEDRVPMARSNRANQLLLQLLWTRYPDIVARTQGVLHHWLSADSLPLESLIYHYLYKVNENWCVQMLRSYKESLGPNADFPWKIGKGLPLSQKQQLALFLAKKHMKNVVTTHGRTLPAEEFQLPWKL
ncbi:protein ABHD16B-like [Sphaerodactylus townsendi]|uniref:protein ABHD16B-like n=1 Tax=Sphaerodactylus townsendi TaxID=933632 RepID=UPI002026FA0C|nr:protein ABHD16B-like [Sphaerodactylus townsendi]